jgi:hypothetical protein
VRRHLLLFGLVLSLAGCAPRGPGLPALEPGRTGGKSVAAILASRPCPPPIAGECEVRPKPGGGKAVRLYGSFRAAWPDRIRLQARIGPFLPIASIAVDGESTTVSLPRQKAYWSGSVSEPAGPAGIAGGLLWLLCPSTMIASMTDPVLDRAGKEWVLTGRGLAGGREGIVSIRLDRDLRKIREIAWMDPDGRLIGRASLAGRLNAGSASVPRMLHVEITDPPGAYDVEIKQTRKDPEQPQDLYRIPRSPGARRIGDADLIGIFQDGGADQ